MCFGSKTKTVQPPPPTPPTTFDYNAGERASVGNQQQVASNASVATQAASFGSELSGAAPAPTGGQ